MYLILYVIFFLTGLKNAMVIPALERAFPRGGREVSTASVSANKSAVNKKKSVDVSFQRVCTNVPHLCVKCQTCS
jgi:hypothetical protein